MRAVLGVYELPSRLLARAPVRAHRRSPCRACRRPSQCRLLSAEHMSCHGVLLSNLCTQCISKDTQISNTALMSLLRMRDRVISAQRLTETIVTSRHHID
jgi:hypothetical protein